MDREKSALILDQTEDVVTHDWPFHECLSEHPELLDHVEYVHLRQHEEPTMCFTATAARRFLARCLQKGYGDVDTLQERLRLLEDVL